MVSIATVDRIAWVPPAGRVPSGVRFSALTGVRSAMVPFFAVLPGAAPTGLAPPAAAPTGQAQAGWVQTGWALTAAVHPAGARSGCFLAPPAEDCRSILSPCAVGSLPVAVPGFPGA